MKKIFIALSVLAVLGFGFVPANAGGIGMPDDAPGCDLIAPFFLASMSGVDYVNTLFVFTDVEGSILTTKSGASDSTGFKFHYSVNTCRSVTVFNSNLTGTKYDIASTDAQSIVAKMSDTARTACEVDLDGDGVNDHYAGYIYFDREIIDSVTGTRYFQNSVVAQVLLVNLADGMAASANLPMKEYAPYPAGVFNAVQLVNTANTANDEYLQESFSPNALAAMEQSQLQTRPTYSAATRFSLYPRYYIADSSGVTWLFIWKSANWYSPLAANWYELHVMYYNADEDGESSNLPLPDELNIINIEQYLPSSLHSGYAKEGWISIDMPDENGLPNAATTPTRATVMGTQFLGFTWIKAVGSASESWTVLNPMWRAVDWANKVWNSL